MEIANNIDLAEIQKRFHMGKLTNDDLENVVISENVVATFSSTTFGWKMDSYTFEGFDAKHFNISDANFGLCTKSKKIIKSGGVSYCDILIIKTNSSLYEKYITSNSFFKYNKKCEDSYRIIAAKLSK